jgi:Pyruvate/2-oxoacid:ferredoxin oxidoreductase delta subunit
MAGRTSRPIVIIDESKCDGCGQCVTACAEGALQIIDGKAKLVSESYCDGLGACLGECPQGAISIEEREAASFDEEAVSKYLAARSQTTCATGCPGSAAEILRPDVSKGLSPVGRVTPRGDDGEGTGSMLQNWPVQLALMPTNAPYLHQAKLMLSADCVPFAIADFHNRFLKGRVVAVGCPKLDDADYYQSKLAEILARNEIESIEVVYMEVPCCGRLVRLVQMALAETGKQIPLTLTRVSRVGEVQESVECA